MGPAIAGRWHLQLPAITVQYSTVHVSCVDNTHEESVPCVWTRQMQHFACSFSCALWCLLQVAVAANGPPHPHSTAGLYCLYCLCNKLQSTNRVQQRRATAHHTLRTRAHLHSGGCTSAPCIAGTLSGALPGMTPGISPGASPGAAISPGGTTACAPIGGTTAGTAAAVAGAAGGRGGMEPGSTHSPCDARL